MNELITQQDEQPQGPFNRQIMTKGGNVGAIAIESERAIAEAQGQLIIAKKFPRSVVAAIEDFKESCRSIDFANVAFYAVPNRGSGPSIRFAEEAARNYGNFEYGHRELSRTNDRSEIEVYAWDKEKNNRSIRQITVNHVMDTKNGPRRLTDQADIDNKIANVASKQMRGRILALLPKHLVAIGIAECKRTLAGDNDKPLSDRLIAMAGAFKRFGVTSAMMEKYLGHKVDDTTSDELADLTGIYNSIKEGAKASDYFKADEPDAGTASAKTAIAAAAAKGNEAVAATKAATEPAKPAPKPAAKTKPAAAPAPEPEPDPEPAGGPAPGTDDVGDAQGGSDDDVF